VNPAVAVEVVVPVEPGVPVDVAAVGAVVVVVGGLVVVVALLELGEGAEAATAKSVPVVTVTSALFVVGP